MLLLLKKKVILLHIIYHDEGGTHSCIIAASMHLNLLPMDQKPSKSQLLNLPNFNGLKKRQLGRIIFHGKDIYDNSIYTMGRKHAPVLIENTLKSVVSMLDLDESEILCVNTSLKANLYNLLGRICFHLGLINMGKYLDILDVLNSYEIIAETVQKK